MSPRLMLLLAACSGSPGDSGPTSATTGTATEALEPTVIQALDAPAVWRVQWTSQAPTRSWVSFGPTDPPALSTPELAQATAHDHPLLGLKAGHTSYWQAHQEQPDGTVLSTEVRPLTTDPPPAELLLPTLATATAGSLVATGFVQFSQLQPPVQSWLLIVDGDGDLVWWRKASPEQLVVTSRRSLDGRDLLYQELPLFSDFAESRLYRTALDGSGTTSTRLYNGHHDFYEWPDGTFGFIQFQLDETQWVVSDALVEIAEGSETGDGATRVYSWLDDYPIAPWTVCEHVGNWVRDPRFLDWTHTNSLMLHPDGAHYLVMSKFHDAVLKIRRSDGVIVWQLGGEHTDFTLPDGSSTWTGLGQQDLWSHGHMSHAYAPGPTSPHDLCLAVFDNGYHRTPEASRLIEVCLDETARVAEPTFTHADPGGGFTPLMGDLRRLDDGWLAGWSQLGRIEELDDSGAVRWQLDLGQGASSGRLQLLDSLYPTAPAN